MSEVGKKYNKLTVLKYSSTRGKGKRVDCKCDCGTEKTFRLFEIKNGKTKSCGCIRRLKGKDRPVKTTKTHAEKLVLTRRALDKCMTENTGLELALGNIIKNSVDDWAVMIAHKALKTSYHAERENNMRLGL